MSDSQAQSKFGTGLLIGFLAGATGYFLFTTEEGQKLKKQLQEKWTAAVDNWPQLTELKLGDLKLAELAQILLGVNQNSKRGLNLKIKNAKRSGTKNKSKQPDTFKGLS